MVNWIDGSIGRVVQKAKDKGYWDNMLFIFSSDNGGPIAGGSTNFPLKVFGCERPPHTHICTRVLSGLLIVRVKHRAQGGKFSNWEGGIRVNAFISGGFVPTQVRGTKLTEMVAGWDWYDPPCAPCS
jgi:arylsulfatase B